MRVLLAAVLSILLLPLAAGEREAGDAFTIRDPALVLSQLAAGPWGQAWSHGGAGMVDALLEHLPAGPARNRDAWMTQLTRISAIELSGDAPDRLHATCTDQGAALWEFLRQFGTADGAAITIADWRAERTADGVVLRRGADPGPPMDMLPERPGLRLRFDLGRAKAPLLVRQPGRRLQIDVEADPLGTSEHLSVGLPWLPLRPVAADALARLPANTLCAIAVDVDGAALQQHLGHGEQGPRRQPLAALLRRLLGSEDPPPWQACDGDWIVALSQSGPLPCLYVRLPAAADPVVRAMLARDGLDPAAAVDAPLLLPERWSMGPQRFTIRHRDGRWHLASDQLLLAGEMVSHPPATPWPAGSVVVGCCDGPLIARTLGGFIAAAASAKPAWASLSRAAGSWLQRGSPQVPYGSLALRHADGVLVGDGRDSMPIFLGAMLGITSLSQKLDEHSGSQGHDRFTALIAATAPGAIPDTCPCGSLDGDHWWIFPAAKQALPEQPVLVLAPKCLGDGWVRGRRQDGRTFVLPPARQAAFLAVADRLHYDPPQDGATGADWAEVIALYGLGTQAQPESPDFVVRPAVNVRFADPGMGWHPFDASKLNAQLCLAYRCQAPERFFAMLIEDNAGGMLVDPEAALDLLESANRARTPGMVRVAAGQAAVAGQIVPWRRYRLPQRFGKPLIRDDIVLLTADAMYEFMATAMEGDTHAEEARDHALAAFAFLDPAQVRPPHPSEPIRTLASERLPYRLDLPGDRWHRWDEGVRTTGWADLAAVQPGLWLVAGGWRIGNAPTSADALAAALFPLIEAAWPKGGFSDIMPVSGPGWSGMQATLRRTVDRVPLVYRLRAIRHDAEVYLLAAWQSADRPVAVLDQAIANWASDAERSAPGSSAYLDHVLNRLGLHAQGNGRWEEALTWFRAAFAAAPRDHVLAGNVLMSLNHLKRPAEGLAFIDGPAKACLEHLSVASWRAYLLAETGDNDAALREWREIFAAGWSDADDLRLWLELLWRLDRHDEALAAFAAYPAAGRTRDGRLLEAELLGQAGRRGDAVAVLRTLAGEKADSEVELRLATALRTDGDIAGALAACDRAAALAPKSAADVGYERGLCLLQRDDLRGARAAFADVVTADPRNTDARAQLRRLDGMLGGAGTGGLQWGDAIPPVPGMGVPPIAEPPGWCDGHDAALVERSWTLACAAGEAARWTRTTRLRVLTARGADNAAKMTLDFNAGWQELCINRLAVVGPDGATIAEANRGDAYVLDAGTHGMGTTKKTAHLPLAGVKPGTEVVCVATWRAPGCTGEMPWQRLHLWSSLPALRCRVELRDPGGRARLVASRCQVGSADGWQWAEVVQPTTWRFEPFAAPPGTWLPTVCIASPSASWSTAGRDYLGGIASCQIDEGPVTDLAQATGAGLAGPAQTTALADAVQSGLSYVAIEFGRRGRIPETAAKTLTRRFGDCKDHAVLLQRLLVAAGTPAWLALAGSDEPEESLPDLDQFDHMVVAVPQADGVRIIDTTDKDADTALPVPGGMGGDAVLVLDPAEPRLVRLGPHQPSQLHIRRSIAIGEDGSMSVNETVTIDRHFAQSLRSALRSQPGSEHLHLIQEHLGSAVGELQSATALHLNDPHRPLVLSLRYRPTARLTAEDGRLHGTIPDAWAASYLNANRVPDRRSPFQLSFAWTYSRELVVTGPDGSAIALRAPIAADDDGHLSWSERSADGTLSSTVGIATGTWPAKDYAAFVDRQDEISRRLQVTLSIPRR